MDLHQLLSNLVCRDHLLSYLQVNDLLRMRRVDKFTKVIADDYIRTQQVKTGRELTINFEDNKPFREYIKFKRVLRDLPIKTKLHLCFLYHREKSPLHRKSLHCLLETCGKNITHLTISADIQLEVPVPEYSQWYLYFFESFPKLEHLVLDCIHFKSRQDDDDESKLECEGKSRRSRVKKVDAEKCIVIPSTLKNLKTLRIKRILATHFHGQPGSLGQGIFYFLSKLVEASISTLERLFLPFDHLVYLIGNELMIRLACLCLFSTSAPNLKLERLHGNIIESLLKPDNRSPEMGRVETMINSINAKVSSISKPDVSCFLHNFPNLEEMDFGSIFDSTMPHSGYVRREWPQIKKMSIFLVDDLTFVELMEVFQFMFGGIQRKKLSMLDITFAGYLRSPRPPFPGTMNIVMSCSNLRTLHLGSNIKELVDLTELWSGLPHLVKLRFDRCNFLNDVDFLGTDAEKPVFFKLKNLKVLEIDEMEQTQVTDNLFIHVLCHMPLKELSLSSNDIVESITLDGLKSLLTGKFARSIERLSLSHLELEDMTLDDMKCFERLFRTRQMI